MRRAAKRPFRPAADENEARQHMQSLEGRAPSWGSRPTSPGSSRTDSKVQMPKRGRRPIVAPPKRYSGFPLPSEARQAAVPEPLTGNKVYREPAGITSRPQALKSQMTLRDEPCWQCQGAVHEPTHTHGLRQEGPNLIEPTQRCCA